LFHEKFSLKKVLFFVLISSVNRLMNSSVHSQAVEAQTINSGGPRVVTLVRN